MTQQMTGMFGPSPYEVQQSRNQHMNADAANFAQMNATQRGVMGMYQGGAGLANIGSGMMGIVDPAIANAQRTEQIIGQGGADLSSSAGLLAKAEEFRKAGDLRTATALALKGNEMKKQEDAAALAMRKQDFQENDAMSLKREQLAQQAELKKEQLQQSMEAAKLRSQDSRYTADQRREASSEATAMRGQIAQLMAEMRRLGIEAKSTASSDAKPKGLTREAGLKWELDNGKIDQATYDAAISASPGGVLRQKQTDAMNTSETGFAAVERNVDQLYDQKNKSLKPAAKSLFGQYAQYRPESTMSQESVDAKLALEGLTDQVMMTNLAEAKARVGQSFGSMQVQEWDKFTQQLTSLKRGLSEEQAATSMANVLDFVKNKRAVLKKALNTDNVIQADRKPAPVAPSDFNARWASLPSGQSLVGPDGKTYTKK